MDEKSIAAQLQQEGFRHTYVWEDGPNAFYPEHTHDDETSHIILSGENEFKHKWAVEVVQTRRTL